MPLFAAIAIAAILELFRAAPAQASNWLEMNF